MNSYWIVHAISKNDFETTKYVTYLTVVYRTKIWDVEVSKNWNDTSTASWVLWVARLLNVLL